jgi:hypothetical protein
MKFLFSKPYVNISYGNSLCFRGFFLLFLAHFLNPYLHCTPYTCCHPVFNQKFGVFSANFSRMWYGQSHLLQLHFDSEHPFWVPRQLNSYVKNHDYVNQHFANPL